MRRTVLWLAAGLLLAGVVLAVLPVSGPAGEDCATPFIAGGTTYDGQSTNPGGEGFCEQPRAQARQQPILLLIVGGALVASQVRRSPRRPEPA